MINLLDESILTVKQAGIYVGKLLGTKPYHHATIYKWMTRGVRGVRLEFGLVGSGRVTSKEAIQRFNERLTVKRGGGVVDGREPSRLPRVRGGPTAQERAQRSLVLARKLGLDV